MKIGIVSDTHGHLDPKIPGLFAGVDHILHAGDIGLPWLIMELEQAAPVTAVLGNNDAGLEFKEMEFLELDGLRILVYHIVEPQTPSDTVKRALLRNRPHLVVFGHTHKAFHQTLGGVVYLNPGYAGKPRFDEPRSVAIVDCSSKPGVAVEFKRL
jgi:putative phosphoesterase